MKIFISLSILILPFNLIAKDNYSDLKLSFNQKRIQSLYSRKKYDRCITIGRKRLSRGNLDRVTYYYLALSCFRLYENNHKTYLFDRSLRYLDYSNYNTNQLVGLLANNDKFLLQLIHDHLIELAQKQFHSNRTKSKKKLKYARDIFQDSTDYLAIWLPPVLKNEDLTSSNKKAQKHYLNVAQELKDLFDKGFFRTSSFSNFISDKLNVNLNQLQTNILDEAADYYGMTEKAGKIHNQNVVKLFHELGYKNINNDETPWCAAFINNCAKHIGAQYPSGLRAKSWLTVGENTKEPKPGDVVVFWRNSKKSSSGHVGLYISESKEFVYCLGGNQGDKVQICPFPKERILQYKKLTLK